MKFNSDKDETSLAALLNDIVLYFLAILYFVTFLLCTFKVGPYIFGCQKSTKT